MIGVVAEPKYAYTLKVYVVPAVAPATFPTALADDPIGMDDPPAPAGLLTHGAGIKGAGGNEVARQRTGCSALPGESGPETGAPFWAEYWVVKPGGLLSGSFAMATAFIALLPLLVTVTTSVPAPEPLGTVSEPDTTTRLLPAVEVVLVTVIVVG